MMTQKLFIFESYKGQYACLGEWNGQPITIDRKRLQDMGIPSDVPLVGDSGQITWYTHKMLTLRWDSRGWCVTRADSNMDCSLCAYDKDCIGYQRVMSFEDFWYSHSTISHDSWKKLFSVAPAGMTEALDCLMQYNSVTDYIGNYANKSEATVGDIAYFDSEVRSILSW